ncbi:MAG: LamG-like jellyroll fold domain-containing protein [Verrucomicrobiia bacterium]
MKTPSEIRLALVRACTLVAAACALSAQAAITDGLVGHWTFNETSGATAKDTSGKGHDGAVSNQWGEDPAWTTGQIGGALSFRGPDSGGDAVIVTGLPVFTDTFSVSAWVLADPRDGTWPESSIVDSSGLTVDGPVGLVIRLKNRDQAFGPLGNTTVDAGGSVVLNETVGFPVSVWQQVGVVADGTRIHLYRNGVEVGTANYVPPLPDPISPELGIGVTPDDGGFPGGAFWQGKIDDVGIWTTPLTASQMASIFNAGQAGKDLTQADAYQNLPPTITTQPISITRFVGETASFSVQAAGTGDLTYQWKLNGNNIAGATASTYTIASVQESDAGQYTVVVTNAGGSTREPTGRLAGPNREHRHRVSRLLEVRRETGRDRRRRDEQCQQRFPGELHGRQFAVGRGTSRRRARFRRQRTPAVPPNPGLSETDLDSDSLRLGLGRFAGVVVFVR